MGVLKHRGKATELALVQAGYTLADIRGEREVHTVTEQPQGLLAAVGRVTPRTARVATGCTLALGLLVAFDTGLLSAVVVSVALAAGLYLLGEVEAEETEVQHEVQREGMKAREVQERLVQWDEWKRIEKEQADAQAKKAKAKSGGTGHRRR